MMGSGAKPAAGVPGLNDPNLSQEDRDHRIAIALQQQENAAQVCLGQDDSVLLKPGLLVISGIVEYGAIFGLMVSCFTSLMGQPPSYSSTVLPTCTATYSFVTKPAIITIWQQQQAL